MQKPKPFFDEVEIGSEVPPLVVGPVDRNKIIQMAILLKDPNPIHLDRVYAKERGLPDVIQQGPFNMASLYRVLTEWLHSPSDIKKIHMRLANNVFPGDRLTNRGLVKQKYVKDEQNYIVCEIWQENHNGVKTITGEATAVLPIRH
ncbi:MAG: MaoC domain-containing protein dehydratase [bacterium]|nr:MAG: MaoC domain-containing protein dehydratase [bacterium]